MKGLRGRPELPWALWTGALGALAVTAQLGKGIHSLGGPVAPIDYLVLPLIALAGTILAALWGAALGHALLRMRGAIESPLPLFATAFAVATAAPIYLVDELRHVLSVEAAVRAVRAMDVRQLEIAIYASPWNRNRFWLGAVAQHRAARAKVLARIAEMEDPALYQPMYSLWDMLGRNREGLAVMQLVARHPNVSDATLARLAAHEGAPQVLRDVLANPKTPVSVLARHYGATTPLPESGLALNPKVPQQVLMRLATSLNPDTRLNLTRNNSTPRESLDLLARDPDSSVARGAKEEIERRRRSG